MYQEEPSYESYFITINNHKQAIIGPDKKIVAIYIIGELEVLI